MELMVLALIVNKPKYIFFGKPLEKIALNKIFLLFVTGMEEKNAKSSKLKVKMG